MPANFQVVVSSLPRATYRLQFNEHFRLRDATRLVPYLDELGISHVYASPLFKAAPHSQHGYDVRDFGQLNPELGTESDLEDLVTALRGRGMGLVLDMVPNHMSVGGRDNEWWWDVLLRGEASQFASYFDIDWQSPDPGLRGKVLLPVLADDYSRMLERGDLRIVFEEGEFLLRCGKICFPLTPESLPEALKQAGAEAAEDSRVADAVRVLNSDAAAVDEVIQQQHYLPACWREADTRLNYRRFFNVSDLAGIRVEDERVFEATHRLVRQWLNRGWLDGLRVDHPDGLCDPGQYLERLRSLAPQAWIVAEKIVQTGEKLPRAWPVSGTTGYDFLNLAAGLFVDAGGETALTRFYHEFTGQAEDYPALAIEKKRQVLSTMFVTEASRLTRLLVQIAARRERFKNFTAGELRAAMLELAAALPVYRTYVRRDRDTVEKADVATLDFAVESMARRSHSGRGWELPGFLRDLLLLRLRGAEEDAFVAGFQQLTGPTTAKGVEDTAFYCYNRLISLNEVGGDPGRFGLEPAAFHETCRQRQKFWPEAMLTTSTHDTKRSEDVRARISLLSEIPERWSQTLKRWSAMNERHRRKDQPDRNAEYFFYQTLVGAWPLPVERALACMEKASYEAKEHTAWNNRNEDYDGALRHFVTAVLNDTEFQRDIAGFVNSLEEAGEITSLAQVLLKLTAPGVPDIYQGCELWDLSLMDPDNRRTVDFELRQRLLAESKTLTAEEIWQRRRTGLPKLWLTSRVLALRKRHPDWFTGGGYEPLIAGGAKAAQVVAFLRAGGAITVAPRLVAGLDGDWEDTVLELPEGVWLNELTGEEFSGRSVTLASLLRKFPVGLLTRKEGG